jgi:hypothetical protein
MSLLCTWCDISPARSPTVSGVNWTGPMPPGAWQPSQLTCTIGSTSR